MTVKIKPFIIVHTMIIKYLNISCRYVDFLSVSTYDFNGAWDTITGMNAPLYPRAEEFDMEYGGVNRTTRNLVCKFLLVTSIDSMSNVRTMHQPMAHQNKTTINSNPEDQSYDR